MNTITTTLTTEAVFSDDNTKRYLLRKVWDDTQKTITVIMLAPSTASDISLDMSTQLSLNNAAALGMGTLSIVNLFATLNDFGLKQAEDEDAENLRVIIETAEKADVVLFAPGVGKNRNKVFQRRQEQVLKALTPYEGKLHCLCGPNGEARLQHPLSPAVRTWHLSPLKISELLPRQEATVEAPTPTEQKKRGKRVVTQTVEQAK